MKIIVCIKQVPDTTEIKLDKKTGTLKREGVPSIINPDDKAALEMALTIKDQQNDVHVSVLCMGPPQADDAIHEALAMGADEGYLVSDRAYAGSDTWATANVLAAAVRKIGDYDLVLCGRQAIDGDTAQVGPQLAERLNLAQVTYARDVELAGEAVLRVTRDTEDGQQIVRVAMPCMLTVIREYKEPRYCNFLRIFDSYRGEMPTYVWGQKDLQIDVTTVGLTASPTNVKATFSPQAKASGIMMEGSGADTVQKLLEQLHKEQII